MIRSSALLSSLLLSVIGFNAHALPASPLIATNAAAAGPIHVGRLTLTPCKTSPAYCGDLPRALDPAGEVPGTISIHFEFYPHRNASQPKLGTLVAAEGGPGYPSTLSRSYYLGLFYPLMDSRDLVLVDNRGTGSSGAINCPDLQTHYPLTQQAIIACGMQLGSSSDLYGTGLAADDMAAVLDALQTGPVDLYGDSYGTYYSEAFAGRHPGMLRSLMLDGTFQVVNLSPWYPANAQTMRDAFTKVCARSISCSSLGGTTLDRVNALLALLRNGPPISGTAPDGNGNPTTVSIDAGGLASLMFSAAYGPLIYRELDGAIRAYLSQGDSAPLLRMAAENNTAISPYSAGNRPRVVSEGLYVAVSCTDYPQIYDMTTPPVSRQLQRNAAFVAQQATHPDIYSPFTIDEFNELPLDFSLLDLCLSWPVPSPAHPPQQPVPPGTQFPGMPTLVLSGELDSLTSPISGAVAASLFPNSQQVLVANSFHVTALADLDDCASTLVRTFVQKLNPGNTSCASQIAEVRIVPAFAQLTSEVTAATALPGNQGTTADLKLAAATALTAGDAVDRWWVNYDGDGVGLRGGSYAETTAAPDLYQFSLSAYRWTSDLPVNGSLSWNYANGLVTATLVPGTAPAAGDSLSVSWNDRQPQALAKISGTIGGRRIQAQMVAP